MIRRKSLTLILIASICVIVSQPLSARSRAKRLVPRVGATLPGFAFTDFAGHERQLSNFAGHYVLMEFWATWCGPCIHEIPVLKRARQLYRRRGLEILGLNSDRSLAKARKFVAEKQIPWPQSAPRSTKALIKHDLKVKWYPTIILLDPQHKILLVSGNGKTPLKGAQLLKELNQLLPPAAP